MVVCTWLRSTQVVHVVNLAFTYFSQAEQIMDDNLGPDIRWHPLWPWWAMVRFSLKHQNLSWSLHTSTGSDTRSFFFTMFGFYIWSKCHKRSFCRSISCLKLYNDQNTANFDTKEGAGEKKHKDHKNYLWPPNGTKKCFDYKPTERNL